MDEPYLQPVLQQYPFAAPVLAVEPLGGAGGFSGACLWRLRTAQGPLCLRRWPAEHPPAERLQQIHRVLRSAVRQGLTFIPAPLPDRQGRTFVSQLGHLWEIAPWLPGAADFHQRPSLPRLRAALQALARFHCAAEQCAGRAAGVSASLRERLDWLHSLASGGIAEIDRRVCRDPWPELEPIARRLLDQFPAASPRVLSRLKAACTVVSPVHPCIRDIWHDHVLFQDDEVTGFIDFGALRTDHAAIDIARLLGSLVADDRELWQCGISAYQQVRALSPAELPLIEVADESSVLLSGLNWLRWIYLEGRQFPQGPVIVQRLESLLVRLQRLVARAR